MTTDQIGELAGLAVVGLGAGFLAGLLGIGGGLVMVPAMVLIFGLGQHVAQGTSLLVIIPAALTGSYTHHRNGKLVLRDAAWLGAGGAIGALIGSVTALALDEAILRRFFAAFLILTALRMLLPQAWFRRRATDTDADPAQP